MIDTAGSGDALPADAALAAALVAVDPTGLGGASLRSPASESRDAWLALLRRLLPEGAPVRRIPLNISDSALLGGLDLGATLRAGRPVAQPGVLAQADGGVVVLAGAERVSAGVAARLAAVLDQQEITVERDGLALRAPARVGLVALDEGASEEERLPAALLDRLAFPVRFGPAAAADGQGDAQDGAIDFHASDVAQARARLPQVKCSFEVLEALVAAAHALGIASLRAPSFALHAARAAAALAGLDEVSSEHAALAARLVLAPRATRLPMPEAAQEADEAPADDTPPPPPEQSPETDGPQDGDAPPEADDTSDPTTSKQPLADAVLEAAHAAIPAGLLDALRLGPAQRIQGAAGRAGAAQKSQGRGRPIGTRRGEPRTGARLNVIETLRAAAPWQTVRRREAEAAGRPAGRIQVRREDFHVTRYRQLGQTTTLFVVDASGSAALHRLAEAKGAVELLLADCYVRRDRVALIAFRGAGAEVLLPPTRSLARAKRSLAALPGGGGTPLAAALDAASLTAELIRRRGETPIVVLLTDGRANIARDGSPGRVRAAEDALQSARQWRAEGFTTLWLDTSPQPQPQAEALAGEMGARYLPLPHAGAQRMSQVVRQATAPATPR